MSEREAEENLTAKLEESGYREELKKKVWLFDITLSFIHFDIPREIFRV